MPITGTSDDALKAAVLSLLAEQDTLAAIAALERHPQPRAVAGTFIDIMLDCYWQRHDLGLAVAFGRAGAQYAVAVADRLQASDAKTAFLLRAKARALCYNVASFCWIGWAEPGIALSPADQRLGLDAARAALRLATELNESAASLATTAWLLGAQLLAARDYPAALAAFAASEQHARAAQNDAATQLAIGFARLTRALQTPADTASRDALGSTIQRLHTLGDDGQLFAGQLITAQRVFGLSPSPA